MYAIPINELDGLLPEPDERKKHDRGACGKLIYTEREAGTVVNHGHRHRTRKAGKHYVPKRKYYCRLCSGWHVTHKAEIKKKR